MSSRPRLVVVDTRFLTGSEVHVYKKLIVATTLLLIMVVSVACGGGSSLPKDAVAMVGGEKITETELENRLSDLEKQLAGEVPDPEQSPDEYKSFKTQLLDYMIILEVLSQKSAELGIEVTDEELQKQIDSIKSMFGGDETQFQEALDGQGLTLEQFEKNLREQTLVQKAVEAVTGDVEVTDDEISSYYEENQQQFESGEQRKIRHILFTPVVGEDTSDNVSATDEQWNKAYERALDIRGRIMAGEDFGEMAKQYSDDTSTKDAGGSLSFMSRGSLVPAFEDVAFSQELREISEPVKTQYGYHLIQALEIKEAGVKPLDEVTEEIRTQLLQPRQKQVWEEWIQTAREDLEVVVREGLELVTTTTTSVAPDGTGSTDPSASDSAGTSDK